MRSESTKAEQVAFPFWSNKKSRSRSGANLFALIGRSYSESEYVTVTVLGICEHDSRRVLVRRDPGTMFSMPGWLVNLIFSQEEKQSRRKVA